MAKKFTATEKIQRAKQGLLRALEEAKNNTNKTEALGFITGQIAYTYALLDSDSSDELSIVFVAANILDEISPKEKKTYLSTSPDQLELPGTEKK